MNPMTFSFDGPAAQAGRPPFRLAIVGEFAPRDYATGKPSTQRFHLPVDKDNFNETIAKTGLRLQFDIPNPLAAKPKEIHVSIPLNLFKALRPDNIVRAVPELKALLDIRELLVEVKQRTRTPADFAVRIGSYDIPPAAAEAIAAVLSPPRKTTKKTAAAPPPPKDKRSARKPDTVENILDMIDTGEERPSSSETGTTIRAALEEFVRGEKAPSEKVNVAAVQHALATVDRVLGYGVDAVIHHPEFKRVERLWRGLKYLIDQTDFRKNIKLEIINAHRDNLLDIFIREIYQPEYDAISEAPLAAAVLAFEFTAANPDIEVLRELAIKAADIPLLVLGAVGAPFFGRQKAAELLQAPDLRTLLEAPEYIKFNGFRDDPASRWLALGFNRYQQRFPYGHEGWAIKSFDYREQLADEDDHAWGNPVWALAVQMVRSQAKTGWATQIAGRASGLMLENLAVHEFVLPNGDSTAIPLEIMVSDRRLQEFEKSGIIPLLCDSNADGAYILAAPTVYRPRHDADTGREENNAFMASLPYQLYAGDIARFINRRYNELVSGATAAEAENRVARTLVGYNISREDPGRPGRVKTNVVQSAAAGKQELAIEMSSPPGVLHGRAVMHMSLPLRT